VYEKADKLSLPNLRTGSPVKQYIKAIATSSAGNILEWYDFGLFTIFATLFSELFFPKTDPHTAIVLTFGISAAGFLCRPLGALMFGYFGDKVGRASTLRLSVLLIAIPTLLIGLLPTYEQIGILAPVLLTFIRMWQGICIGGEFSGNFIYLAETAPTSYRATCSAFANVGANLGLLLAGLVGMSFTYFFSSDFLHLWGWRIPYFVSGVICLLLYQYRLRLPETNVFIYLKKHQQLKKNPIKTVFQLHMRPLLKTLGIVCMGTTFYYFCFAFLPIFLATQPNPAMHNTAKIMAFFVGLMFFLVPIGGLLCDLFGRKKLLLATSMIVAIFLIPGFYLFQFHSFWITFSVLLFFTFISSFEQGTTPVTLVENFPPETRYTGVSLGFSLGNGLLGGTVPFVCQWLTLSTNNILAPAIYVACWALVTVFVVYFFIPETRGINLSTNQIINSETQPDSLTPDMNRPWETGPI
jgi:MHS family proline/betaine transporter-like MFS transporter